MKIRRSFIYSIMLLVNFLLFRPSLLGQNYASISVVLSILFLIIFFADNKNTVFDKITLSYFFLYLMMWFGLVFGAFLSISSDLNVAIKAVISNVLPCLVFFVAFSTPKIRSGFFFSLSFLVAFFGYSSLITFIIYSIFGYKDILLFQATINGYSKAGLFYFPFSVSAGEFNSIGISFLRFSSFMREPGIYQAVATFSFFYMRIFYNGKHKMLEIGSLLSLILTFSTPGFTCFMVSLALYYLYRARNKVRASLFTLIFLVLSVIIFLYMPVFGYFDKIQTHGASISDRTVSFFQSYYYFVDNPFGTGYLSLSHIDNANISLVSSIGQVGIFVFLLILMLYLFPILALRKNDCVKYFILTSPFFLTMLVSQPVFDSPGSWVFFMTWIFIYHDNHIGSRLKNV